MKTYAPQVLLNHAGGVFIVFAHGRTKYSAIHANGSIHIVTLNTLRGLTPAERRGEPYSPKRAASYWLNHSAQPMHPRARKVLRSLVRRDHSTA